MKGASLTRFAWLSLQRYHGAEARNGQQGNASDDGLAAYVSGEDVNNKDVVLWYCAHTYTTTRQTAAAIGMARDRTSRPLAGNRDCC